MNNQIDRRRLTRPGTEDAFAGAERFGVHTFGSFLKQERLNRGLSRAVLAANTSIASARIGDFESNAAVPSLSEIDRLADALGTARGALIREAGMIRSQAQGTSSG